MFLNETEIFLSKGEVMTEQLQSENKPVPIMVRLPADLHAAIKQLAESERRSMNSQIIILLESAIKATVTDD